MNDYKLYIGLSALKCKLKLLLLSKFHILFNLVFSANTCSVEEKTEKLEDFQELFSSKLVSINLTLHKINYSWGNKIILLNKNFSLPDQALIHMSKKIWSLLYSFILFNMWNLVVWLNVYLSFAFYSFMINSLHPLSKIPLISYGNWLQFTAL